MAQALARLVVVRVIVLVLVLVIAPSAAVADRAVGRTDRLEGGTVELGLAMEYGGRRTRVRGQDGPQDFDSLQVAAVPRVRVWFAEWLDLELRQPLSFVRTLEVDDSPRDVDDVGVLDTELRAWTIFERGPLLFGGGVGVVYPSADEGFGTERTTVNAALLAGWRAGGAAVHVVPSYTIREGDSYDDAGDVVGLEVGYTRKLGALTLAPIASVERTRAMRVNGFLIEEAFTTWRMGGVVAREQGEDKTVMLSVQGAWAREHAIAGDERVGAREVVITLGLAYAWDLWTPRAQAVRARDPAAISIAALRVDGQPATAQQLDEIRHMIPRLRLATMDAEHDAGGVRGSFRVRSTGGGAPGAAWRVDVDDEVGQPRLTAAIGDFFRDAFPAWARNGRAVELHLCFDRCVPAR